MTRLTTVALAVGLGLQLSFNVVHGMETRQTAKLCSGYAACLQRARHCLEKDDRAGALAALREARAALASCLRQSADETALAAL